MSIETLRRDIYRRAVAVVHLDNGQVEELHSEWKQVNYGGYIPWRDDKRSFSGFGPGQLDQFDRDTVRPFIDDAAKFNVRPTRIDWHKEHRHEVIYKTTGYSRELESIKE